MSARNRGWVLSVVVSRSTFSMATSAATGFPCNVRTTGSPLTSRAYSERGAVAFASSRVFIIIVYAKIPNSEFPGSDRVRTHWFTIFCLDSRLMRQLSINHIQDFPLLSDRQRPQVTFGVGRILNPIWQSCPLAQPNYPSGSSRFRSGCRLGRGCRPIRSVPEPLSSSQVPPLLQRRRISDDRSHGPGELV